MKKSMVRKGLVLGIIILFLGASVLPSISGNIKENDNNPQVSDDNIKSSTMTDWWPMFHHDLQHTGYSTANAPDTNNILWSYTTGDNVRSSPAITNNKVYIGSKDDKVYCLNADTGAFIWSYTTGNWVDSSPAIYNDKIYIGSFDDKVYCLNADTGAFIWSYTTGDNVRSSPAITNNKVYIGSDDGKMYCLNADTGAFIWSYTTGTGIRILSSPATYNDKIYFGSSNGYSDVYCLNADTGAFIWNYTIIGVNVIPAVANGNVFFCTWSGTVYCLNANTGAFIWSYDTYDSLCSSPAVADGKVYFGSRDNKMYCLNAETGAFIWSYTTGDWVDSSPAIVSGRVYVGSWDNKIYCFAEEGNQPPEAPTITGETDGEAGIEYEYTLSTIDPNGDDVKYYIDWGDGDTEWTGFSASGTPVTVSHTWAEKDTYTIAAKAQDEYGLESDWGTLEVEMPVNQQYTFPLLQMLLERFPLLQRLLNALGIYAV